MALFSRNPGEPSAGRITERCYLDPPLEAALDAVQAGQLEVGLRALADTRGQAEWRSLRSMALGPAAARYRPRLAQLQAEHSDDPDVNLLLGRALIDEAWEIRGGGWAERVGHSQFEGFFETLDRSGGILVRAAELAPQDPTPWQELQWFGLGMELEESEHAAITAQVTQRAPWHFGGHVARMNYLCEKWHGSHELMFGYTRAVTSAAPPGDPVQALLPLAHFEYVLYVEYEARKKGRAKGFARRAEKYFNGSVLAEVAAAEAKWLHERKPHPRDLEAHHAFGGVFFYAGDTQRAAWHLSQVGNRATRVPWGYAASSVARGFARARAKLNLPPLG